MLHTKIVDSKKEKILTSNAEKFIKDFKFGASIYFLGTVRNINDNKKVTGITYDSHDEMVIKSFEEIYNNAEQKLDIKDKASIDDLRNEIIKYIDKNFQGNENFINVVKSSAFCSENNEIISDNYKITKDQKIGIIPPIGGG